MTRYILNILLGLGYLMGFVLVWLGLELVVFSRDQVGGGLLVVAVGVAWWSLQVFLGKRLAMWRHKNRIGTRH